MKSLIIYCSDYRGNTEEIAKEIAEEIGGRLVNIRDLKDETIHTDNYDLIGFGSGVYRESISNSLYRLVDDLDLEGRDTFVFSTSGVGIKLYNNKLIKLLEKKGASVRGNFACKGSFTPSEFTDKKIFNIFGKKSQGHPNRRDRERAKRFILDVIGDH
ncbi:MAG: hypothetical protein NUK57_10635 [Gudongella sp.]|nr:hypothetical protein [Gudongella sp.]